MPLLQSFPSCNENGSGGNVNGYFNPADNLFYREDTYTTPIPGDQNTIYVSLDTNKIYRYNGTIFVPLGAAGEDPQAPELPQPSITEVNNIYQYTGPTNNTYKNGYFYKCIFNGTDYEWVNVLVQPGGESTILTGTLLANSWSSNAQTVQIVGVDTDTKGVIGMLDTATTAQLTAAASAEISVTAVGNGIVTFACETVPSIDIPFGILISAGGSNSSGGGSDCSGELYLNTIYSETEEKVGYWTDGRPIYQKTIIDDTEHNPGTIDIAYNVSNIGDIIDIKGACSYGSNSSWLQITYSDDFSSESNKYGTIGITGVVKNLGVIRIHIGSNYSSTYKVNKIRVTIQYTKTTDTPEIPQRGNVIYLPTIYSQEEREIGVWTDGKSLYQKTYIISNVQYDGNWHATTHGISNIDTVASIEGTISDTSGSFYSCNVNRAASTDGVIVEVNSTNIEYINNYISSPNKLYVTIQYTKTTDTAGSGTWTPSGAPAVHYSTNEHIVGTWVDGKTLYEKTYYKNVTSRDTDITVDSSIDKIWHIEGVNIQPTTLNEVALNYFADDSDLARCYYNPSTHTLQIRTGSSYGQGDWYITIRYTKSTS